MKALLAGWFSFEGMGATAGDLMARDVVARWLKEAGVPFDVVVATPFAGGVTWSEIHEKDYSHLIFVCGPFGNGSPVAEMLDRFSHCRFIGINLSMLEDLDRWNPFDLLIERDSAERTRPDLVFLADDNRVPVIGLVLVYPQKEYGSRARHGAVERIIAETLDRREAAAVRIDTRLDHNFTGLRTPREVESLIARMDAVITTRLHGTVLALKNGVPAVAIDPISGGAKITKQIRAIGWPVAFVPEDLGVGALNEALDYCLTPEARRAAAECRERAVQQLAGVRDRFFRYCSEAKV